MTILEKKIRPELFEKMQNDEMHFDVRLADFDCNEGDVVKYREWNPDTNDYTGRDIEREITHCLSTKDYDYWSDDDVSKHGFHIIRLKKEK